MRKRTPAGDATVRFDGNTIAVAGKLDFESVPGIEGIGADRLADRDGGDTWFLDLSGVDYSDSAGVALILAWQRAASTAGRELVLRGAPDNVLSMIHLAGLEDLLDIEETMAADPEEQ